MLDHFNERLNRKLYDSKRYVKNALLIVKFLTSLAGVFILVYSFGFKENKEEARKIIELLDYVFTIFVIIFITKLFYAIKRKQYILDHKFESFLILLIILNGISNFFFNNFILIHIFELFHLDDFVIFKSVSLAIYLLTIIGYEFVMASMSLPDLNLRPPTLFILSFILLIIIGALVLMLPTMTTVEGSMPFIDALFTSTSAVCVTGLIVVDTATYFTFRGQVIILLLIQAGGLGLIAFASFFAYFIRKNISLKEQVLMQDYFSSDSLYSAKNLLKQVVLMTLSIEAGAAILIYLTWGDQVTFVSDGQKIYYSIFHAISAFCNAGFSLFSNNLYEGVVRNAYSLHIVVSLAVILGGIGFATLQDLFSPSKLRERLAKPWIDWKLGTKIAVYTSAMLIFIGTIIIFSLEYDHTLSDLSFGEKIISSYFQSVITRTAGFNSMDFAALQKSTLVFMIFLMFIGASSGSVGGGIKTSTFYLIMISAIATLRGKSRIEINKREIPKQILFKALSIFFFAATIIFISIFLLSIFEPDISILELAFEEVSAFATVGLSTGITGILTSTSKTVLIVSMFLGRVGILTFALALSSSSYTKTYKYPSASLMVG
ncbi:TrkH family potassium uptake protein [Aureibacter tunicatorum]|uniref:Potassium uptake TrkH family protein n=1 Tax=Aureibacter tunicatorum TaxID=866807 RepID=A0AAE4BQN4_9BACT|nr:potassium transporter TrkG [Aureibacter tunicatorum]MDR6237761.1 potassium uptake TrkH family protein [Aureibacter tunicatorum]BDD02796.1 potassium transporter [Aureibacter tunicatorum]